MLNKAEQTTQTIMTKYDSEVQKLTKQVRIDYSWRFDECFIHMVAYSYTTRLSTIADDTQE